MKMHFTQPVDAPPAQVFTKLDNIEGLVADLADDRMSLTPLEPGQWAVVLHLKDRARNGTLHLAAREVGTPYCLTGHVDGLELTAVVSVLSDDDAGPSAMDVSLALAAHTLRSRVMLAGLTVTQGHLHTRLASRLAAFAKRIEERGD